MKRILIFLCTIASTAGYISCSDSAIGDEYGSTLIYMPQATHNLGTDNNLTLKLSKEAVTATPSKRTQTTLGIYRAGTAPKESATVDLLIDKDYPLDIDLSEIFQASLQRLWNHMIPEPFSYF